MEQTDKLYRQLSAQQKRLLEKALEEGSTVLFNIKGMVQVLHTAGPFDFIGMGYEDIEALKKKGLLEAERPRGTRNVLQGEEYVLTSLGKAVADKCREGS